MMVSTVVRSLYTGMTTATRVPLMPELATIAEAGFPGYEAAQWYGILAPARTARPIIAAIRAMQPAKGLKQLVLLSQGIGVARNSLSDFEPVARGTSGPMVIVTRQGFPANTLPEFIQYLRSNADKISLAHAGVGSASHLCALMMMSALKVKLNEVPYKGTGPALVDLAGGQVDILCDQTSGTVPLIKGGRIKAIAAASAQRIPSLPDMPVLSEAGVPGVDINISFGMYAPKGTPKPEIDKLTQAMQAAVTDPEVKAKLEAMGVSAVAPELARPEALRAHLRREIDVLGGLLIKAGVKPE